MVISSFRTVHNTSRMIWLMSTNFIEVIVVKFYRHELCNSFCWLCHPSISIHPLIRSSIHCISWKCIVVSQSVYKSMPMLKLPVQIFGPSCCQQPFVCWCACVRAPWVNICRTVCSINAIKCREISCGNIIVRLSLFVYFVCIVIVDCW